MLARLNEPHIKYVLKVHRERLAAGTGLGGGGQQRVTQSVYQANRH